MQSIRTCGELGLTLPATEKEKLDLLASLKTMTRSKAKRSSVSNHIVEYPNQPSEGMIRELYDSDDPPAGQQKEVGSLSGLRKSSSKFRGEIQQIVQPQSMVPMANMTSCMPYQNMMGAQPQQMMQQMMGMFGPMMMAGLQQMMQGNSQGFQQMMQGGCQAQTPGLQFLSGNKAEQSFSTPPTTARLALPSPPSESPEDDSQPVAALDLPEVEPLDAEQQAAVVKGALAERTAVKETKAKAKPKAKAKGKGKAKAKPAAQAPVDAEGEPVEPKAKQKSKAKAKPKDKAAAHDGAGDSGGPKGVKRRLNFEDEYGPDKRPEPMKVGDPTCLYNGGKIHFNAKGPTLRVFLHRGDRNDCKVKVPDPENMAAEWQKALDLIDEAAKDVS